MLTPRFIGNVKHIAPRQVNPRALPAGVPANENRSNIVQTIPEGAGGTNSLSPESESVVQTIGPGMACSQPR